MEKLLAYSQNQLIVLGFWALLAVILINSGGKHNTSYVRVVQAGFRLIVIGVFAAGALGIFGSTEGAAFTGAATNFVLIFSAAIGANYISHAKMSLRNKTSDASQSAATEKVQPSAQLTKSSRHGRGSKK